MTATISHHQLGAGTPVVLLHPSAFGPDLLLAFAQRLADDHLVVVPHRRGYGGSAALPPVTSLDDHHDDLAALLDHLGLDDPTVVGVSAGATLALGFAAREAARGTGRRFHVVAHEPLVGPLAPTLDARVTARIARLLARADQPHEVALFMSELVGISTWNHLPIAMRNAVEDHAAVACREADLFSRFALTAAQLDDLGSRGTVTTVGSRSSEMRQEAAAVLAGHGVEPLVVEGAGHLPPLEVPGAYARLVGDLAARWTTPDVIGQP